MQVSNFNLPLLKRSSLGKDKGHHHRPGGNHLGDYDDEIEPDPDCPILSTLVVTGWGEPKWALQELERLMQWQILQAPDDRYKHHW